MIGSVMSQSSAKLFVTVSESMVLRIDFSDFCPDYISLKTREYSRRW